MRWRDPTARSGVLPVWERRNRVIPSEHNDPTRQRFSAAVRTLRRRVVVHVVMNRLPE